MRSIAALAAFALAGCATATPVAQAQTTRVVVQGSDSSQQQGAWIGGSPVRTRVVVGADGETYVGVWIDAPDQIPGQVVQTRPPMALSLVIDTSGSMSGEKIDNARIAASSLLESLADGDIVSIYAFSNGVQQIAAPTQVGPNTRGQLMQAVRYIHAGGGTNMYGGVTTGINSVGGAPSSHEIRRVVLISDGHANIGPSDPGSLGTLAANGTEYAVQISAIGVGLDYDENTLGALAVQSSGRLYHLEHPYQMAQILEREVQLLASTIATDAVIEVVPAPGVTILEGVSQGANVQNNRLRVPVGSVFAGQQREILFRARVDTNRAGERNLGTARLRYRDAGSDAERTQEAALQYEVTRNRNAATRSVAPRVQAMVATFQAAEAQRQAAQALTRGDRAEAQRQYEFADEAISGALASPVELDAETRTRLEERSRAVRTQRTRAAEAATPAAARSVALDSYDDAMSAEGY